MTTKASSRLSSLFEEEVIQGINCPLIFNAFGKLSDKSEVDNEGSATLVQFLLDISEIARTFHNFLVTTNCMRNERDFDVAFLAFWLWNVQERILPCFASYFGYTLIVQLLQIT